VVLVTEGFALVDVQNLSHITIRVSPNELIPPGLFHDPTLVNLPTHSKETNDNRIYQKGEQAGRAGPRYPQGEIRSLRTLGWTDVEPPFVVLVSKYNYKRSLFKSSAFIPGSTL
jgi:hypothetical protein